MHLTTKKSYTGQLLSCALYTYEFMCEVISVVITITSLALTQDAFFSLIRG